MGIDPQQLRSVVIRPVLCLLGLGGAAAEELVLGTALAESGGGARLVQLDGPALSPWQIEPATAASLLTATAARDEARAARLAGLVFPALPPLAQLAGNLWLAAALCRLRYWFDAAPLPAAGDLAAQAAYWKRVYNTAEGAGTADAYIRAWRAAMPDGA